MAEVLPRAVAAPNRAVTGIICVLAGMLFFVGQDVLMKMLLGPFTIWTLMAVRGLMAMAILVPIMLVLGAPHRLWTPLWPLHLLRGALFAIGFSMFYAAFPLMGLAEVSTIFFASPLILAVFAAVLLGEHIGIRRTVALLVGFGGVVIAMAPTSQGFNWAAVLPLGCAVFYGLLQILARVIGDRDSALTTGVWTIVSSSVLMIPLGWALNQVMDMTAYPHLGWHLAMPTQEQVLPLLLLGSIGMCGFLLLSRAYQIAPASVVAPFDYAYLPLATALAWVYWGEVPMAHTLMGMALIVASGLYLGYRELRHARRAHVPAPTAEAVFTPGNPAGSLAQQGLGDGPYRPFGSAAVETATVPWHPKAARRP